MITLGFFFYLLESINNFFAINLKFDEMFLEYYNWFSTNIPEIFKWLLLFLLAIIVILGTISLIKKTFKLFIVIAVIAVIISVFVIT